MSDGTGAVESFVNHHDSLSNLRNEEEYDFHDEYEVRESNTGNNWEHQYQERDQEQDQEWVQFPPSNYNHMSHDKQQYQSDNAIDREELYSNQQISIFDEDGFIITPDSGSYENIANSRTSYQAPPRRSHQTGKQKSSPESFFNDDDRMKTESSMNTRELDLGEKGRELLESSQRFQPADVARFGKDMFIHSASSNIMISDPSDQQKRTNPTTSKRSRFKRDFAGPSNRGNRKRSNSVAELEIPLEIVNQDAQNQDLQNEGSSTDTKRNQINNCSRSVETKVIDVPSYLTEPINTYSQWPSSGKEIFQEIPEALTKPPSPSLAALQIGESVANPSDSNLKKPGSELSLLWYLNHDQNELEANSYIKGMRKRDSNTSSTNYFKLNEYSSENSKKQNVPELLLSKQSLENLLSVEQNQEWNIPVNNTFKQSQDLMIDPNINFLGKQIFSPQHAQIGTTSMSDNLFNYDTKIPLNMNNDYSTNKYTPMWIPTFPSNPQNGDLARAAFSMMTGAEKGGFNHKPDEFADFKDIDNTILSDDDESDSDESDNDQKNENSNRKSSSRSRNDDNDNDDRDENVKQFGKSNYDKNISTFDSIPRYGSMHDGFHHQNAQIKPNQSKLLPKRFHSFHHQLSDKTIVDTADASNYKDDFEHLNQTFLNRTRSYFVPSENRLDSSDKSFEDDDLQSSKMSETKSSSTSGSSKRPQLWTKKEDELLKNAVEKFGAKKWKIIAEFVPGRNHTQCLQRWTKVLQPGLKKGPFTKDEDAKIISAVTRTLEEGKTIKEVDWEALEEKIEGRSRKQIRERWRCNLDPQLNKSKFIPEEDEFILQEQAKHGNKWALIARKMNNRTEHQIKTRFRSLMRSKSIPTNSTSSFRSEQ